MDAQRFQRANEIFDILVETPLRQRCTSLDIHCGSDPALRAFVENLLSCHDRGIGGFLSQPALDTTVNLPSDGGAVGEAEVPVRIGRYEIVRVIAEGGMGTVYEARQEHPKRRVALKVIRHGFASPTMLRRFQYEAEVLGRLQHPGIAQIFEAGTAVTAQTPAGPVQQPFFAMEFVEGPPLTDYARDHHIDIRLRLELVARVCDAVQHAHQKGVIHRDLKPANILVANGDQAGLRTEDSGLSRDRTGGRAHSVLSPQHSVLASAQPKVLDFGIARTTGTDVRTVTFGTSAGQIIGTLAYMSPEQVSGDSAQLDTRSDVYSLGVILYELLTGRLPYDVTTCSIAEAARKIRDDEPARLTAVQRSLSGDLEILVAKALAKDKARRYQSASDLADDLRRYLASEPIDARRDSPLSQWYLLRKAIARHRGVAIASAAFVLLLISSTIALAFMYGNQVRERNRATAAATEAEAERSRATDAATRAEAVNSFLENMLWQVDPQYGSNAEVTVRQVLDQAIREIEDGSLQGQPELEAAMRATLGQTYSNLGAYPEAEGLLESALAQQRSLFGARSHDVGDTLNNLGALRHSQGRYADAEPLLTESLAIRREILGPVHAEVANVLHNLGAAHYALGDPERAEAYVREALQVRRSLFEPDHPEVASSLCNLASLLNRSGRAAEGEALLREVLAMDRQRWGGRRAPATEALNDLAFLLQSRGDFAGAEPLYREALALSRQIHGAGHPSLAASLNNLAALLRDMGNVAAAEGPAREGLEIRRKTLPPDHPHIGRSAILLGLIKLELNQAADSEPLLRECLEIRKKSMEEGHHLIAEAASALGDCLTALERYDEAEPLLVDSYPVIKAGRGERHERTLEALRRLMRHYEARGRHDRAAEYRLLVPTPEKP